jgi:hypothetical protein
VFETLALALAVAAPGPKEAPFPLRTDLPPKEWRADEINEGLPLRWEKGTVHVLAWERVADDRPHEYTQALVLKRFDQPTEDGGHRWVLAQLYHYPGDQKRPWHRSMRVPAPVPIGQKMPDVPDAWVFGYEFYDNVPTDEQIKKFLRQAGWAPTIGPGGILFGVGQPRTVTTRLAAGGVDRALWKKLFDRDVRPELFPELKKAVDDKK